MVKHMQHRVVLSQCPHGFGSLSLSHLTTKRNRGSAEGSDGPQAGGSGGRSDASIDVSTLPIHELLRPPARRRELLHMAILGWRGTKGAWPHLAAPSQLREPRAAGTRANRSPQWQSWRKTFGWRKAESSSY